MLPTAPNPTRLAYLAVVAVLAGCGGSPVPIPADPLAALDLAKSLLDRGEPADARGLLGALDPDTYFGEDRARLDLLRMQAEFDLGEYWDAFTIARDFVERHRFSNLAGAVEEIEFACGKRLLDAEDDDGEAVLMHFVERFESSAHAPEALKLLGEFSFAEERYALAEERFRELLQSHPSSAWAEFARYRLAITSFRRVRGPEYDLDQMMLARNELARYLERDPERPEFRDDAARALATVEVWIARRHIVIADFYETIGNREGEVFHLGRAAERFPGTPAGAAARQRLDTMQAATPADEDPTPTPDAPPPPTDFIIPGDGS